MSHLPSPLPSFDRRLMRALERVVPAAGREDWSRTWEAELWHVHHRGRGTSLGSSADLSIGLVRDALWLRTDNWRRACSGTAMLCLATLAGVCVAATLTSLVLCGDWHSLGVYLYTPFKRFLIEAVLVVFVASVTASRGHVEQRSGGKLRYWIKQQLFFVAKTMLILVLTFLLSADISQSIHASLPNTADFFQTFIFVIFALFGLRWGFHDQEQRCKQCLRSLAKPARVGRPSHNLLEWNGTELVCKQGHGLLSVPEMESSWCQSSQWVVLDSGWDEAAST